MSQYQYQTAVCTEVHLDQLYFGSINYYLQKRKKKEDKEKYKE